MNFKLIGITQNNEQINLPTPIWFSHTIDLYGTYINFKFTFTKTIPTNLVKVNIMFKNKNWQNFIVDKIQQTICENKSLVFLTVSHPICYVWQNYVEPKQFNNLKVETFFKQFCEPFNIKSISPDLLNHKSDSFFTTLGMTYWDVISLFFKKEFNISVFVNEEKKLTMKYAPIEPIKLNLNKLKLRNFNYVEDRTNLLSTIYVQQIDDLSNSYIKFKSDSYLAMQNKINRSKFFKIPSQFKMLPDKGALAIIEKHNANYKTLKIEISQLIDSIFPGTIIEVEHNNFKNNMCVKSFSIEFNKLGALTKIELLFNDLFF